MIASRDCEKAPLSMQSEYIAIRIQAFGYSVCTTRWSNYDLFRSGQTEDVNYRGNDDVAYNSVCNLPRSNAYMIHSAIFRSGKVFRES